MDTQNNTYKEQVNKYQAMFPAYFDKARELIAEYHIDGEYMLEKYGCSTQNTEDDILMAYAEHGCYEILCAINANDYRELNEDELLFIRESVVCPFRFKAEFYSVNMDEIHSLKDVIPYVLEETYIDVKEPWENDESEEQFHEMYQQEVNSFDNEAYETAVIEYMDIKNSIEENETEIIGVICGDYSVEKKNEQLQKYLEYIDDLYEDVDGKFSLVSQIGERLEECISKFPEWSEVTEDEILAFEDKVTFNYLLILFHKYRLCMETYWEDKLLEAMVHYFRKHFNGAEFKSEVDMNSVLIPSEKATTEDVEVMRCYNNIYAYYSHHKKYFDDKKYQEVVGNTNIEKTSDRTYRMLEEMFEEQRMIRAHMEKQQTLFAHAKQEEKEAILKQISEGEEELVRIEKTIEARYAREIIASSMDVVFVLKEYIATKLKTNPVNEELLRIKNSVRVLEADIKNTIYGNPYILDFYREDREHYNAERISYKELQNENKRNMLVRAYYKYCIEALENADIDSIMSKRNELLTDCDLLLREDEDEIETIGKIISELAIKNVTNDTTVVDINSMLEAELGEAKKILPSECYKTLYTAEYLYHIYVKNDEAKELMDYSCISALYYQALEGAYNKLIYTGYIDWIMKSGISKELNRYKNPYKRKGSEDIAYGYFPETRRGKDCFAKYWSKDNENCMYADFIYLLECANENSPEVAHFCEYLRELWGDDWDHEKMKVFCEGLEIARPRRNAASHGGTVITKKGAETDKKIVLLEKRTAGLKDLIVKLCEFFV